LGSAEPLSFNDIFKRVVDLDPGDEAIAEISPRDGKWIKDQSQKIRTWLNTWAKPDKGFYKSGE